MPNRILRSPMLRPLAVRDYRLLVAAAVVSLLGDGFFYVALAWQVYEISNLPSALSLVGAAWTLPNVLFVLLGGALTDRYDRRRLMIGADLLRGIAIAVMAALSFLGDIQLWQLAVLIAGVGIGDAFFNPASTAIVPDLVPEAHLPAANALAGMYRPLVFRLVGPALAGIIVAVAGPAIAFGVDALTFAASALLVAAIRTRPRLRKGGPATIRRTLHDIGEGLRFVRGQPWIWATLVSAMLSLLVFLGPVEVLLPFLIKNRLGLGADSLGLTFAAGGVGSVLMAFAIGHLGQPRRRVSVMFFSWSAGVGLMAIYGLMTSLWQALLVSAITNSMFELGSVIWTTLLQQRVPRELLGRVSSLDWLISTGLVPISFALTGPVADLIGPERLMVAAALLGAVLMVALLFVPGVRDPEQTPVVGEPARG